MSAYLGHTIAIVIMTAQIQLEISLAYAIRVTMELDIFVMVDYYMVARSDLY